MTRCPTCKGSGTIVRLLMSQTALQKIKQLAELLPDEPVPTREETCPDCRGTGARMKSHDHD